MCESMLSIVNMHVCEHMWEHVVCVWEHISLLVCISAF